MRGWSFRCSLILKLACSKFYVCWPAIYCAVVVDSQNNWTIMVFLEYRAWLSSFSKVIKGNERQQQLIGSKVFSNVTEGVSGTKWAPTYFQGYPSLNQNWHAKCLLRKLTTKVWVGGPYWVTEMGKTLHATYYRQMRWQENAQKL